MKGVRALTKRLTVPHVLSALALFVALGGTAVAVGIAKNSVGSPQIKPKAVKTSDIGTGAVTTKKLHANAVNGARVRNASLSGDDINQETLDNVRAANVLVAMANGDGQCTLFRSSPGVTASHEGTGTCLFTFPRDVSACAANATVSFRFAPNIFTAPGTRTAWVKRFTNTPSIIRTQTYSQLSSSSNGPIAVDFPVDLTLVC